MKIFLTISTYLLALVITSCTEESFTNQTENTITANLTDDIDFNSNFEEVDNKTYTFASCETCEANCCDGRKGSVMAPINLEDFEPVSMYFPIAFLLGEMGYIQPVVFY